MAKIVDRFLALYNENETKIDIAVFVGGFLIDILFMGAIDDLFGNIQSIVYLAILGSLLYYDFLYLEGAFKVSDKFKKYWDYRQLAIHFFLGSLLSIYSLFYLKSASIFNSVVFVAVLMVMMIANETRFVRENKINLKIALFVLCLFSFFSMMIPTVLGFVGLVPFLLAGLATLGVLYLIYLKIKSRLPNSTQLNRALTYPSGSVLMLFIVFYILGWIPPVPISIETIGVYHDIKKQEGQYIASYESTTWNFFNKGESVFLAEPGDKIFLFVEVFSPAKFSDSVILNWQYHDTKLGWKSVDKIPMNITGGRAKGYRGSFTKQNYVAGEWRVSVETTDGREIGRHYFEVVLALAPNPDRAFVQDIY